MTLPIAQVRNAELALRCIRDLGALPEVRTAGRSGHLTKSVG